MTLLYVCVEPCMHLGGGFIICVYICMYVQYVFKSMYLCTLMLTLHSHAHAAHAQAPAHNASDFVQKKNSS
jgi:hypothetical protein